MRGVFSRPGWDSLAVMTMAFVLFNAGSGWGQNPQSRALPVTYYDFNASHADFESPACRGGVGMVQDTLDPDKKPINKAGNLCFGNSLHDWFRKSPDNTSYCKNLTMNLKPGTSNVYEYSDLLFFPLDSVPTNENIHKANDGLVHNFHFCMEMHAGFIYRGGEKFDFRGDDDVWVYVNNTLALDLGGVHGVQSGSIDLDAQKDKLKIQKGIQYDFDFFFCERNTINSDIDINTTIDIREPPTVLRIIDLNSKIVGASDTLTLAKGGGSVTLKSVKASQIIAAQNCIDVTTEEKTPVIGSWTLGSIKLPDADNATINPDLVNTGLYKLVFQKDAQRDSVWIRVTDLPTAATPTAVPPGRQFSRSLTVFLVDNTPGAIIHYTLDGSIPTALSPVYANPLELSANTVIKAIATAPGHNPSQVMTESYGKLLSQAVKGYYQDRDGDGRIETAVLLFDSNYTLPPAKVAFTDPFAKAPAGAPISAVTEDRKVTYTLPPFLPGTAFTSTDLAQIAAQPGAYPQQALAMDDSVGPVAVKAVSFPTAHADSQAVLEADIGESVTLVQGTSGKPAFPFEILRQGVKVDPSQIRVASIQPLSTSRYRITFAAGSKYPIPGDSLRLTDGSAVDLFGNRSRMATYIPVGGIPAQILADLSVTLEKGVLDGPPIKRNPSLNPVVVHGQKVCLNCSDPGVREILPASDPAQLSKLGPTWIVMTKYPFRYSLSFYDNLGQFINRAQGEVSPPQFETIRAAESIGDSVAIRLTFLPISHDGFLLGTGAYIMKGTLKMQNQDGLKGAQGEKVMLTPSERNLVSRFGYMRKK